MKLSKDNWIKVSIGSVCGNVSNISKNEMIGNFTYIEIGAINSDNNKIEKYETVNWKVASPNAKQIVYKNDTLCSTVRVNLKKIAKIDKDINDGIATVGFCVLRANEKKIDFNYLFQVCLSNNFTNSLLLLSSGTTYPIVKNKDVLSVEIPLPPLKEQKQIAALFQSIDNAIEQTEAQEKSLTSLRTKLATELVSSNAQFGNLLNSKNCNSCTLGDIAREAKKSTKSPLEEGIERFVSLTHIDPGNLKIQRWGNIADGTSFTKTFKVGDVLFGRRRAYLKKAACADFEGLCSGDITVLRANSKFILPELLPYYLSAEPVFEYAVSNSAGSLSPRVKWRDLSKYELAIPDLKIQEKILDVFQSIDFNINQNKIQRETLKKLKQNLLDEILG